MKNNIIAIFIVAVVCIDSTHSFAQPVVDSRPNILMIVADDLGYADLGCYGGEIKTPNIDALATKGILFTHFHTSPLCAPTRSMLLSGNDNHIAGMGSMFSVEGTNRAGKTGYERHLTDRIITIAQLLKDGGYQTFMTGKWHLGSAAEEIPFSKGFERSFALMNGAANHFNNQRFSPNDPSQYRLDTNVVQYPDGSFSTDVYTDKMMGYIDQRQIGKPFFAYLAYTAPHWPLQVPKNYIDRYKGKYEMGYDSLRVIRFANQKAAGIVPEIAMLSERNPDIRLWTTLGSEARKSESRKMEIYAAMVENLDDHIGQLMQFLGKSGLLDNTVIVFMSDNGAAGEDFYNLPKGFGPYLRTHYDNSYENMGTASSFVSYGPQWAQAGAAPFRLYKSYATEGGIVAPLIISGKFIDRKPGIDHSLISVMDLAPGFLDLAQLSYPEIFKSKTMIPQMGSSFVPYLKNQKNRIHNEDYSLGLEHDGECMLIKGQWKITNISEPFDENAFALYDLSNDLSETNDLSKTNPAKYSEMLHEWKLFVKKAGVISKE